MSHNPNSYIHKAAVKVIKHLVDEAGVCNHTSVALGAMLGMSEQTVYVIRVHLESCPLAGGYRLPYRAKGPLILTDPDKNETTLQAASVRAVPVMDAAVSVIQSINRMKARNVDGILALSKEAYASLNKDLGDALDAAATDIRDTGALHVATVRWLASLGVTLP